MDSVLLLTEIGIANYNQGDHSRAEQCFSQALCRVDVCYQLAQEEEAFLESTAQHCHHHRHLRTEVSATSKPISTNATLIEKDTESTTTNTTANNIQVGRTEYDEGMRVYESPLTLHDVSNQDCIASTLSYNMGQTHARQGFYDEANTWFQRALELANARNANTSLLVVKILHCLGYCSYRNGNDAKASIYYQQALAIVSELKLGPVHLAASLNCVGVLHFNKEGNNTDLAMELFVESLKLYQTSNSGKAAAIATVMNNIGRVHYLRSDFGDALVAYQQSLKIRREVLGNDSMDVAATVYNIGQTCHQLGKLDDSLEHYKEFLRIASYRDGAASSKDLALVYKGIAEIYHEQSDLGHARSYFSKALAAQSAEDAFSTDMATTLNKLGNLCYEMKDFAAAMKHYLRGLDVERRVLPANHPHTIITLTNIAHIHKQLGEHQQALVAYQNVGKMQVSTFGSESLNVAETLSSIGLMQYHLRDYESSFESYQEALRIRRQCYGHDDHPDIASTLNSVGLVLFKQDLFDLAKKCFTESLRIRVKILGKNHRDVAILWYNIATIHFETGEDDRAIEMYKETLRVERAALGNDHYDVVLTLQHLGQVHQQLGQIEEALRYFQEALDIERNREDSEKKASSLGRCLNLMGNVYLQLGKTEAMMKCYVEASRIYESDPHAQETLVVAGYTLYGLSKSNPPGAPVA